MTEFRRPKPYQKFGREYFQFLQGEFKNRIWLKDRSSLLLAAYALPILAAHANIEKFSASPDEKTLLTQYTSLAGSDLPAGLRQWYAST